MLDFPLCCGAMLIAMSTMAGVMVDGRDNYRLIGIKASTPSNKLRRQPSFLRDLSYLTVKKNTSSSNDDNNQLKKLFSYNDGDVYDEDTTVLYSNSMQALHETHSPSLQLLKLTGGASEEVDEVTDDDTEEEEEYDSCDDEDEDEDDDFTSLDFTSLDYAVVLKKVTDVTKAKIIPLVIVYSKKGSIHVKNASVSLYNAMRRALQAGFNNNEDEDDDGIDSDDEGDTATTASDKIIEVSVTIMKTLQRMIKAAMTVPNDEEDISQEEDEDESDDKNASAVENTDDEQNANVAVKSYEEDVSKDSGDITINDSDAIDLTKEEQQVNVEMVIKNTILNDFGSYLAENYNVVDTRADSETTLTILGGSLQDAVTTARQQARMLIIFIPSERPKSESWFGGGTLNENDQIAIESILTGEVAKAANKRARKKGEETFGSFLIWGCKSGSSEASSTIRKLKLKEVSTTGKKRPILCAVYPAQDGSLPKVVAQHHCNPPLKADSMASWMDALRKRHGKQYQTMQKTCKELQYYLERQEGYISSIDSDNERIIKEAKEVAERKKIELKEAARQAEIDVRRQELLDSLPEDMKAGDNVKKIALRFADGRTGQRGFASDQPLSAVFNFVDAVFEIEREKVILTTLNGKQSFSWNEKMIENTTLEDAGLKKMTAFRVSESIEDGTKKN